LKDLSNFILPCSSSTRLTDSYDFILSFIDALKAKCLYAESGLLFEFCLSWFCRFSVFWL